MIQIFQYLKNSPARILGASFLFLLFAIAIWLLYLWLPSNFPEDFPSSEKNRRESLENKLPSSTLKFIRFLKEKWEMQNGEVIDFQPAKKTRAGFPIYDLSVAKFNKDRLRNFLKQVKTRYSYRQTFKVDGKISSIFFRKDGKIIFQLRFLEVKNSGGSALAKRENFSSGNDKNTSGVSYSIVIFGFGNDFSIAETALKLEENIAFAIVPGMPYSKEISRLFAKDGRVILLQMPMESIRKSETKLNKLTLLTNEDDFNTGLKLEKSLEDVSNARGIMNFMGSAYLKNPQKLNFLMDFLKQNRLFFLFQGDFSEESIRNFSRKKRIPYFQSSLFLNSQNEQKLSENLRKSEEVFAGREGVILSAEVSDTLLQTLQDFLNRRGKKIAVLPFPSR